MDKKTQLIINIVLDVVCIAFAIYLIIGKLPCEGSKETLVCLAFGALALYFLYSAVTKVIYLVKNRNN